MSKESNKKKILIIVGSILLFIILSFICLFLYLKSPVNKNEISMVFEVKSGESYGTIGDDLKESKLIRSEFLYKVYVKLLNPKSLEAGVYNLSPSMNLETIINTLIKGAQDTRETASITFVEGKNMRYVIEKIVEELGFVEEDILDLLNNEEYLNELILNHWILTDIIKNDNLYYSLEGYLYPDTYEFYKDSTIEEVFEKMISNLETKLINYKDEIENSGRTLHEMITLASIIEQEAGNSDDRKGVAGVFYNRLNDNWSLGSDVTTYYAEKLELWSRDLYKSEINECNDYNTRSSCMAGKLPIGPICNPSINSVVASIEPDDNNYYYFVADVYGHTYFNESASGHLSTVQTLKNEGKWYEYGN